MTPDKIIKFMGTEINFIRAVEIVSAKIKSLKEENLYDDYGLIEWIFNHMTVEHPTDKI